MSQHFRRSQSLYEDGLFSEGVGDGIGSLAERFQRDTRQVHETARAKLEEKNQDALFISLLADCPALFRLLTAALLSVHNSAASTAQV